MRVSAAEISAIQYMYARGNFAAAEGAARRLLGVAPRVPELHDILCTSLLHQGKTEEAEVAYRNAIAAGCNHAEFLNGLGVSLLRLGRAAEAIEVCRGAIKRNARYWQAYVTLADACVATSRYHDAITAYDRALRLEPNNAPANASLASALQSLGRYEDAMAACERALAIDPHCAAALSNQAAALCSLGRATEAIPLFEAAIRQVPGRADLHNNLAIAYLSIGAFDKANASCEQALSLDSGLEAAHLTLADIRRREGKLEEAAFHYRAATTAEARGKELECIYALGNVEQYNARLNEISATDTDNRRVAALDVFASHQRDRVSHYPFCRAPLGYIHHKKTEGLHFGEKVVKELLSSDAVWEPPGSSTRSGLQTRQNIFDIDVEPVRRLKKVILNEAEEFFRRYRNQEDVLIKGRPKKFRLNGWVVNLTAGGHQTPHIHPSGWLSGVYYMRMPAELDGDEGAIRFGVWGYNYPVQRTPLPCTVYKPSQGDLILFPSSLFHETVPFRGEFPRTTLAFDLCPSEG